MKFKLIIFLTGVSLMFSCKKTIQVQDITDFDVTADSVTYKLYRSARRRIGLWRLKTLQALTFQNIVILMPGPVLLKQLLSLRITPLMRVLK